MAYLLDTNIIIFILNNDSSRLSKSQKDILSSKSTLWASIASFHEMAVKIRKGNSPIEYSIDDALNKIQDLGINILSVKEEHIAKITEIPKIYPKQGSLKPHGDPFDLLIISQSLVEKMPILSTDEYFPIYDGLEVID